MYSGVKWIFERNNNNKLGLNIISHSLYSTLFIESVKNENFGTYHCRGQKDRKSQYVYFVSASTILPKST